ncbi:MAG: diguanylate cyclase, partial [Deltaproteobacteria bacterium]
MPQTILLIDDVATNRIILRVKLASAHYNVLTASNAVEALELARSERPALVMATASLSDIAAGELCLRLRAIPGMTDAGIVLIADDEAPFSHADALAAGADDILCRPLNEASLMPLVRSLVRRQRKSSDLADRVARLGLVPESPGAFAFSEMAQLTDQNGKIAIVSPDPTRATQLKAMLAGNIRDRLVIQSLDEAAREIDSTSAPDLILLDVGTMDIRTAISCIADFRHRVATANIAIVVITAYNDAETAAVARDLGAADALPFGVSTEELSTRLRSLLKRKRADDLQRYRIDEGLRLAAIDPLTGLLNRRAGLLALERLIAMTREQAQPLALLVFDVDGFKSVNDTHGHAVGDAVLTDLAERVAETLRTNDLFVRLGGDEFFIALPGAQAATGRLVAERIRKMIESATFVMSDGTELRRTLSLGLAMSEPQDALDPTALIALADQA